jgi:hypothetical protein
MFMFETMAPSDVKKSLHVRGRADRFRRARDLVKPVLEAATRHEVQALGLQLITKVVAQWTIERAIDLCLGTKGVGCRLRVGRGHERRQPVAALREELELAADQHGRRVAVGVVRLVAQRKGVHLHPATGFRLHPRPHFDEAFVQGALHGLVVVLAHLEIGCASAAGHEQQAAGRDEACEASTGHCGFGHEASLRRFRAV